ncbi:hypothetical protein [Phocaeicola oris]|nr:hypothetical protein [Phocaeicola oris]MCE2616090.1 hypothetical protein [Phocaeicola oris]
MEKETDKMLVLLERQIYETVGLLPAIERESFLKSLIDWITEQTKSII